MKKLITLFLVVISMSCNDSSINAPLKNQEAKDIKVDPSENEKEILSVIDKFINAINNKNPELVSDVLDSELDKIKIYVEEDSTYYKTGNASLDFLSQSENKFYEKYWDPIVTTDGHIASVWAPYQFYLDDVFSHCGTNLFFLVKEQEQWKIVHYGYTIDKNNCEE